MISPIHQAGAALRDSHQRIEASAERVSHGFAPPHESESSIRPVDDADGANDTQDSTSRPVESDDTSARDASEKLDLARELAEQIQARHSSDANVALIHSVDETVGRFIDSFA